VRYLPWWYMGEHERDRSWRLLSDEERGLPAQRLLEHELYLRNSRQPTNGPTEETRTETVSYVSPVGSRDPEKYEAVFTIVRPDHPTSAVSHRSIPLVAFGLENGQLVGYVLEKGRFKRADTYQNFEFYREVPKPEPVGGSKP
jgi:hypothetical protein